MKPTRPTIYDVAQRAGVSKSLVSLVLQASPKVSDARKQAVQQAIDELGYRPSRVASALAGSGTKSIGVVIDDFRNTWYVNLLAGMREVLDTSGYHVTVADNELNSHLGQSPIEGFLAAQVEGLVIAGEADLGALAGAPVPTVMAGARLERLEAADFVASDDRAGAAIATQHLLDLGHRNIAHLTGEGGVAQLRAAGYRDAMDEAGFTPLNIGAGSDTSERSGYASAVIALAENPEITAIFAANDPMAVGALAALRESGRSVPRDFSVLGYDDSPLAQLRYIDLTTMDDGSREVGRLAARLLWGRLTRPDAPVAELHVAPRLVARGSTGPVPNP